MFHETHDAVRALRHPDQRGMGRATTPEIGIVTEDRIDVIEAVATAVSAWNPMVIPGLLQTAQYAAGVIKMTSPALPAEAVQRLTRQRSRRIAAFLHRWQTLPDASAWFVVGEQALTQPLLNAHAHADQLAHVLDLAAQPRIEVQVLQQHVPTPGRTGQFALYKLEPGPDDEFGARLGYLETPVGAWYTQRVDDIARLHNAFCDMTDAALSQRESVEYLKEVHALWMTSERAFGSPAHGRDPATAVRETAWKSRGLPPAR
jgi:hypothetical protein